MSERMVLAQRHAPTLTYHELKVHQHAHNVRARRAATQYTFARAFEQRKQSTAALRHAYNVRAHRAPTQHTGAHYSKESRCTSLSAGTRTWNLMHLCHVFCSALVLKNVPAASSSMSNMNRGIHTPSRVYEARQHAATQRTKKLTHTRVLRALCVCVCVVVCMGGSVCACAREGVNKHVRQWVREHAYLCACAKVCAKGECGCARPRACACACVRARAPGSGP